MPNAFFRIKAGGLPVEFPARSEPEFPPVHPLELTHWYEKKKSFCVIDVALRHARISGQQEVPVPLKSWALG